MFIEKIKDVFSGEKSLFRNDPVCRFRDTQRPIVMIIAAVVALVSAVCALCFGSKLIWAILIGEVNFLMFALTFKARKEFKGVTVNLIALAWAFAIFWIMQIAITPSLALIFRSDLSGQVTSNVLLGTLSGIVRIIFNTLLIYSLIMLISSIFRTMKVGLLVMLVLSVVVGVANNFVVQSRGREISFIDLKSIGTALSVVGDYSFKLAIGSIIAIVIAVVAIVHIVRSDYPKFPGFKKPSKHFLVSLCSLFICIVTVFSGASVGYASRTYRMQGTEYNGYYLNFIYSIKNSRVEAPDTYSPGALLSAIEKNDFSSLGISPTTNVIVVMNESFADLKGVCDSSGAENELLTDTELLPYWNSLENGVHTDENGKTQTIIKGDAVSSVYGGNTANSEYEFLSGASMAFLPEGTVAYNGKVKQNNAYTLVNFFNSAGYRTVAMHPEAPENWSRNSIYKYYGFDEIYFKGDFTKDMTKEDYYRGHVSDAEVYKKIINLFENKEEGEKFFTFAITMMNHGGYKHAGFKDTVNVLNDNQGEANEYLSSANEADKSLQILIDYFKEVEEETLIVFFGDHQPTMPDNFLDKYMGINGDSTTEEMQKMYTIPYMFWSNFEMESDINTSVASINYLSNEMLNVVGVRKSHFFGTLDEIKKTVTAINYFGWYDADGDFHSFKDKNDTDITEEEKKALELYEHLVYNLIFDDDNKMVTIFDSPKNYGSHMIVHSVDAFRKFRKSPKIFTVS